MNQDQPLARNSSREAPRSQGTPRWIFPKKPSPEKVKRTMNLREALNELGLTEYHIYLAVDRDEIQVIQPGGKGRLLYLEHELRALAERLGKCPYTLQGAA